MEKQSHPRLPQGAKVQLRSWMIPAEACPGTFVTLKGACGKTTTGNKSPGAKKVQMNGDVTISPTSSEQNVTLPDVVLPNF